jgi:transposase
VEDEVRRNPGNEAGPGQEISRAMAGPWLAQANINADAWPGMTSAEQAEIKLLKAQIKRLRKDNNILKAATVLFARELDPRNR